MGTHGGGPRKGLARRAVMSGVPGRQPTYQEIWELCQVQARHLADLDAAHARVAALESALARAHARIADLEHKLDEALRAGKRQAAPFSKRPPKDHPEPPGRKPGDEYGQKAHRPAP